MALATAVYIDGYNFYYGRIRGSDFKWLDVVTLFDRLLKDQDPDTDLRHLHYFSAPALGRFATHGEASVIAQQAYLRALACVHPVRFKCTMGNHSYDKNGTKLPEFVKGQAYDRNRRVLVWKLEEKQTDVNLALSMYRDAASGAYQQMVVSSNDSDVEPVLKAIRTDFPKIRLGVVTPRHPPTEGQPQGRAVSSSLSSQAHWTRSYLNDAELEAAQLPRRVHTGKKPILIPEYW
jgi:hypothetical protein